MTNQRDGTLYTGVTSDLIKRVYQHREGAIKGFTRQYGCKLLVYFQRCDHMETAILEEKRIKGGSRKDKIILIQNMNPQWKDLYETLF